MSNFWYRSRLSSEILAKIHKKNIWASWRKHTKCYFGSLKPQIFMYSRWRHPPKTVSPRPYCRSRRGRNGLGSETSVLVQIWKIIQIAERNNEVVYLFATVQGSKQQTIYINQMQSTIIDANTNLEKLLIQLCMTIELIVLRRRAMHTKIIDW